MGDDQSNQESIPALEDLERVGQGRTAEIFGWGSGRALRLSREGASRERVLHEMRISQSVSEAGLPAPAVYPADSEDGLVGIGGRIGFETDWIDGPSMLDELSAKPWRLWRYARLFAGLHLTIHGTSARGLPSQRQRFHRVADRVSEWFVPEIMARIHASIDDMPTGDRTCHGDFHPDNVLMSSGGAVIIDWGPATLGCPAGDVAWTVYLFRHGGVPPGKPLRQRLVLALFRRLFLAAYRRAYLRGSTLRWKDIERLEPIVAAMRLGDGIPEERDLLIRRIREHFG